MAHDIEIPARFRGPPSSGNGGYVAGALAQRFRAGLADAAGDAAVEVTLRAPIPLDTPMTLGWESEVLRMTLGEQLIAEACPAELSDAVPEAPGFEAALAARGDSPSLPQRQSAAPRRHRLPSAVRLLWRRRAR